MLRKVLLIIIKGTVTKVSSYIEVYVSVNATKAKVEVCALP